MGNDSHFEEKKDIDWIKKTQMTYKLDELVGDNEAIEYKNWPFTP